VLLSGGLDSATVAAGLRAEGWRVHALTVDYGQRHGAELAAARALAAALRLDEHRVIRVPIGGFGGSALTEPAIAVPKAADPLAPVAPSIPVTYVPARNLVLLALAFAFAEARGAEAVAIGVNALDWSGYPDCRPEFVRAFAEAARLGTRRGAEGAPIALLAPLQELSKAQILARARALGVPVERTQSCYDPAADGAACGLCDACRLRARAERELRGEA
jgi:7-cyano-7-deazaguanine synthase